MAKQTLKARRSLKKGSLRRKTPAHPPVPATPAYTYAADDGGYEQGYRDGGNNAAVVEALRRGREMTPRDLGCWHLPFVHDGILEPFDRSFLDRFKSTPPKAASQSLFARLKAWWPL